MQVLSTSFWQGLHFSRCQGLNPDKDRVWRLSGGAPSAIFNGFDFFALELENFRSPAGASLGSEGSGGVPRGKVEKGGSGFSPLGVLFPAGISGFSSNGGEGRPRKRRPALARRRPLNLRARDGHHSHAHVMATGGGRS